MAHGKDVGQESGGKCCGKTWPEAKVKLNACDLSKGTTGHGVDNKFCLRTQGCVYAYVSVCVHPGCVWVCASLHLSTLVRGAV